MVCARSQFWPPILSTTLSSGESLFYDSPYILYVDRCLQRGLNTKRFSNVFLWVPRNLSHHMIRQARTGDTVVVKSREMTGWTWTLPWRLGGARVKTTENNILALLGASFWWNEMSNFCVFDLWEFGTTVITHHLSNESPTKKSKEFSCCHNPSFKFNRSGTFQFDTCHLIPMYFYMD